MLIRSQLPISPCVYAIVNTLNGKLYVGSAARPRNRIADHRCKLRLNYHSSPHLQKAWNKYGEDAFRAVLLVNVSDLDQLLEFEQLFIDFYQSYLPKNGYNTCRVAGSSRGRKNSKRQREMIKARWSDPSFRDKVNVGLKRLWSDATYRKQMSDMAKKRWKDPSFAAKVRNDNRRKVICNETSQKFDSITEAASFIGGHKAAVLRVIQGKQKSTCGLTFSYAPLN